MALKPIPVTADGSGPEISDIEGLEARLTAIENRLDGLEN